MKIRKVFVTLFLLFFPLHVFAEIEYQLVLKYSGKVIRGKYLREDAVNFYLEIRGITMDYKKALFDLEKTKEINQQGKYVIHVRTARGRVSSKYIEEDPERYLIPQEDLYLHTKNEILIRKILIKNGSQNQYYERDLKSYEEDLQEIEKELGADQEISDLQKQRRRVQSELNAARQELSAAYKNQEPQEAIKRKSDRVIDLSKKLDEIVKKLQKKN